METLAIVLFTSVALALGAMSPGPSFIVVARMALANSRTNGIAAAIGMGIGGLIFSIAALLGLTALLVAVPVLYLALKVVGGMYLIYLGFRLWRSARRSLEFSRTDSPERSSILHSFLIGLATQLSNPKTALVYAGVFTAFLPSEPSYSLLVVLPGTGLMIETGWYSLVAITLSAPVPRARYLKLKAWIDRAAGVAMAALGAKLTSEAIQG
jgi:threonine/homoserine/homoserine lactone efflux protein